MTQQEFFSRYSYSPSRDRIGGGGFGTVYKAKDNVLHREVAIKVSEVKTTADGKKTFSLKDEFEALNHVPKHPNIANYEAFYSYESPQGLFDYAVMQYYPDGNLGNAIRQGLTAEQKEDIATQLLEGIAFLHQHKVVHRDLKPGNILIVRDGNRVIPLITDFGLSKAAGVVDGSVFSNSFGAGTPRYSSPEQLQGNPLRFNTDLWSYGAILYELFTGEQLFSAGSGAANTAQADMEIYNKIVNGNVQSLGKMPETWRKVTERCLVVDATKRAKDAGELFAIIKGDEDETEITEGPSDPGRRPPLQRGAGGIPKTPAGSASPQTPHSEPAPLSPTPTDKPNNKKGLWIGIGIAAAVVVALLLLLKPKQEPTPTDPDTQAYEACQTVADYRAYLSDYGRNAIHYNEAQQYVDNYIADSSQQAQQALAEVKAMEQVETDAQSQADAIAKAEMAEKKEEEAYKKCTSLLSCYRYNKSYPNGRFHDVVQLRMYELEPIEWAMRNNSVTITFNPDSYNLPTRRAVIYMREIAEVVKTNNYKYKLRLTGTGDGKASQKNQTLAENRCKRIKLELMELGMPEDIFIIETTASEIGYGRVRVQLVQEGENGEISELQTTYGAPNPSKSLVGVYYFPNGNVDMANTENRLAREAVCDYMGSGKKIHGFEIRGFVSPEMEDRISNLYANAVVEDIKTALRNTNVDVDNLKFKGVGCGILDGEQIYVRIEWSDFEDLHSVYEMLGLHGLREDWADKRQAWKKVFQTYPQLVKELAPGLRYAEVYAY